MSFNVAILIFQFFNIFRKDTNDDPESPPSANKNFHGWAIIFILLVVVIDPLNPEIFAQPYKAFIKKFIFYFETRRLWTWMGFTKHYDTVQKQQS